MPEQGERCQLCGSPVEVVSSDEGTSCYRPAEQGDVEVIRAALRDQLRGEGMRLRDEDHPALAALDRLQTALENERKRAIAAESRLIAARRAGGDW